MKSTKAEIVMYAMLLALVAFYLFLGLRWWMT
jgi:hypothetical protein